MPPVSGVRRELFQQGQPGATHPPAALLTGVPVQILSRHLLQLPRTHEAHQQMPPVREPAGDPAADAAAPRLLIWNFRLHSHRHITRKHSPAFFMGGFKG